VTMTIAGMWWAREREEEEEEEEGRGIVGAKGLAGAKVGVMGEFVLLLLLLIIKLVMLLLSVRDVGERYGGLRGGEEGIKEGGGERGLSMYSLMVEITSGS
jgi:hypothetical protein